MTSALGRRPARIGRWDLFLMAAGRLDGIGVARASHLLFLKEEASLRRAFDELVLDRLLVLEGDHYLLAPNPRARSLARALSFALAYGIDYDAFLGPEAEALLRRTRGLDYFTAEDVPKALLEPALLGRLLGSSLLLMFKVRPFLGRIIENPFLESLCEFLGIPAQPPRVEGRRMLMGQVIAEKEAALKNHSPALFHEIRRLLGEEGLGAACCGLSEAARLIKEKVVPENRLLFDPAASACYRRALELMRRKVARQAPLSVELILEYHGVVMESSGVGSDFRDFEVQIRNNPHFRTAHPREIAGRLVNLAFAERQHPLVGVEEVLKLCARFFNDFLFIHPFEDGNSRTARVLLAHLLRESRAPFEEIPETFEVRFLQATKGLKQRSDRELVDLLMEIYLLHLNRRELQGAREPLPEGSEGD